MSRFIIRTVVLFIFILTPLSAFCGANSGMLVDKEDYDNWIEQKAKYIFLPNTYFCYQENNTRAIANRIIAHGQVTGRELRDNGCYFVNTPLGVQIIELSSDHKIAKIITHKKVQPGKIPIYLFEAFTPVVYLQSLQEYPHPI